MDFRQRLQEEGVLLFDGAMGTMLQREGLEAGHCPEEWNLLHPEKIKGVHQAYAAAGADIVETNTFGGNRIRLEHYNLADRVAEINQRAVELAREAVGQGVFVAAAVGPLGEYLAPVGKLAEEEAFEIFAEQVKALAAGGPDLILIETMADLAEISCAVKAARSVTSLPILAQMTFTEKGRTIFGVTLEEAGRTLVDLGADGVGVNCTLGPEEMLPIVEGLAKAVSVPVSAQPNAGLPVLDEGGKVVYPVGPKEFSLWGPRLVSAGARLIGGCCGTTPEHIASLRRTLGQLPAKYQYE